MPRITITDWAKGRGVNLDTAKSWARRGKLRTAAFRTTEVRRWTVDADEPPPGKREAAGAEEG